MGTDGLKVKDEEHMKSTYVVRAVENLSFPLEKINVVVVSLVLLEVNVAEACGEGLGLGIADPCDLGCVSRVRVCGDETDGCCITAAFSSSVQLMWTGTTSAEGKAPSPKTYASCWPRHWGAYRHQRGPRRGRAHLGGAWTCASCVGERAGLGTESPVFGMIATENGRGNVMKRGISLAYDWTNIK